MTVDTPTPTAAHASIFFLPSELWERIFIELLDCPDTLLAVSRCCTLWRDVLDEPGFRAAMILKSSCPHLVFHHLRTRSPHLLTFEICEKLLALGSLLPKYFVEQLFRESQDAPEALPEGSVEFLVAQGYKRYGDKMRLAMPFVMGADGLMTEGDFGEEGEDEVTFEQMAAEGPLADDAAEFEMAFSNAEIDLVILRKIVQKHHYTTALQPPRTKYSWDDHWEKLLRLVRVEPKLARHLMNHAGCDKRYANDKLVARAIQDPKTTVEWCKWMVEQGFEVSSGAVVEVLASPDVHIYSASGKPALDLLKQLIPAGDLKEYAEFALIPLLRDAQRSSLRAADFLIDEFDLSEEAVGRALFVNPYDVTCVRTRSGLGPAVVTTFGKAYGGMRDGLWQLMLGRYGVDHSFAAACLNDLVVGGAVPPPVTHRLGARYSVSSSATEESVATSSVNGMSFRGWGGGGGGGGGGPPGSPVEPDDDADQPARDSLEAMVEAGVTLEPSTFGPVSRVVLETKRVAPRHLDWLARIEKGLLETAASTNVPDSERRKWSRVRWVAAFQRHVLNDPEFKELAPLYVDPTTKLPGNGHVTNGTVSASLTPPQSPRTPTRSFFSTFTETIGFVTDAHADMRRFHSCVAQLVVLLETPRANSIPRLGMLGGKVDSGKEATAVLEAAVREGGPFAKWLREIDAKPQDGGGWVGWLRGRTGSIVSNR
ncbi:hypothetical protein HDV00_011100 [Rhizophlyctis rosea]|nr:hypothetical protein HDV00_011100 [Rhizophlyctis rosea]